MQLETQSGASRRQHNFQQSYMSQQIISAVADRLKIGFTLPCSESGGSLRKGLHGSAAL
jgi:hypothetical protein